MTLIVQKTVVDSDRHEYLRCHKPREKDVVGIVKFDPIIFSHQSHYCLCYNGISASMRKSSMLTKNGSNNAKYLKFHCCKVESSEEMANSGNYPGDFRL